MDFESIAAIVFLLILGILLYRNRSKLDTKQVIPYFLYFSMYRTKLGLSLMDKWSSKHRKFTVWIGYFGIVIGFVGMALISFSLIQNLFMLFAKPEASSGVGLVLPFKAKGVFYVPFFYWIISIFVIAVVHEFSHGLIARANNIKVKSSGFAFLALLVPIIPAAFVEPDEKTLKKRPYKEQLSVFAAGPLANIVLAFLLIGAMFAITPKIDSMILPNGVVISDYVKGDFPAKASGMQIGGIIQQIDGKSVEYVDNLSTVLKSKKPGDAVTLKTDKSSYQITLGKNPDNESSAYLGAYLEQSTKINDDFKAKYGEFVPNALIWIYGLIVIMIVLNLGIGLFNLVPLGPLDGGRMLQLAMHKFFGVEKGNKYWYYIGMFFLAIIFINIAAGFGFLKLFR